MSERELEFTSFRFGEQILCVLQGRVVLSLHPPKERAQVQGVCSENGVADMGTQANGLVSGRERAQDVASVRQEHDDTGTRDSKRMLRTCVVNPLQALERL